LWREFFNVHRPCRGEREGVLRLSVECPVLAPELILGQSVAIAGVCLTVVSLHGGVFDVEIMPETIATTRFSSLKQGTRVNLERAMTLGGRLDGHLVQGHADGTAVLEKLTDQGRTKEARFRASRDLLRKNAMRYIVAKGSVAVDGVSLTVIDVDSEGFSVGLIPATLEHTTLGLIRPRDVVNVETDIIGKYVERLLGSWLGGSPANPVKLTLEGLCKLGY